LIGFRSENSSRQVALDVPRVDVGPVERRGEQQDEPIPATDEELLDGRHRTAGAIGIPGAGEHAPGLGDGVDPAFSVHGGPEWRPIVEVRAAVPVAVPAVALQGLPEGLRVGPPA